MSSLKRYTPKFIHLLSSSHISVMVQWNIKFYWHQHSTSRDIFIPKIIVKAWKQRHLLSDAHRNLMFVKMQVNIKFHGILFICVRDIVRTKKANFHLCSLRSLRQLLKTGGAKIFETIFNIWLKISLIHQWKNKYKYRK